MFLFFIVEEDNAKNIANTLLQSDDFITSIASKLGISFSSEQEEHNAQDDNQSNNSEDGNVFEWPDSYPDKVLFIMSLPFLIAFVLTIPDCRKKKLEKWYVVTFFMSILWIGGLCHAMVEIGTWVGCLLNISPPVMGILLLAAGISIFIFLFQQ